MGRRGRESAGRAGSRRANHLGIDAGTVAGAVGMGADAVLWITAGAPAAATWSQSHPPATCRQPAVN